MLINELMEILSKLDKDLEIYMSDKKEILSVVLKDGVIYLSDEYQYNCTKCGADISELWSFCEECYTDIDWNKIYNY